MDWIWQTLSVLGLFGLRFGVPLALMLALGSWLRRLDAKWQAEAMAREATRMVEAHLARTEEPIIIEKIDQPCWVLRNCSAARRDGCPACQYSDLPCWLARYRAEGQLPARCYRCRLFTPRQQKVERQRRTIAA